MFKKYTLKILFELKIFFNEKPLRLQIMQCDFIKIKILFLLKIGKNPTKNNLLYLE